MAHATHSSLWLHSQPNTMLRITGVKISTPTSCRPNKPTKLWVTLLCYHKKWVRLEGKHSVRLTNLTVHTTDTIWLRLSTHRREPKLATTTGKYHVMSAAGAEGGWTWFLTLQHLRVNDSGQWPHQGTTPNSSNDCRVLTVDFVLYICCCISVFTRVLIGIGLYECSCPSVSRVWVIALSSEIELLIIGTSVHGDRRVWRVRYYSLLFSQSMDATLHNRPIVWATIYFRNIYLNNDPSTFSISIIGI